MNQLIIDVTENTFSTQVEQSELPVLLDFWAPWCGPCKMLQPILDDLAQMYRGRVTVAKINVDENKTFAQRFAVRGLPTLLLLKGGEEADRAVGLNPREGKARFVELLDRHIEADHLQQPRSWQAFHNDAELKRKTIEQVRRHIANGQIRYVESYSCEWPLCDEDEGAYSLFGAALHGTGIEAYETTFGIPASAALLEDAVHNFLVPTSTDAHGASRQTMDESVRDFPLEWLEGIPTGADLTRVVPGFLRWLLLGLADGPLPFDAMPSEDAKTALRSVARLHERLCDGDVPSPDDWKEAREGATAVCPRYEDDPVSWGLVTCAGKLAWSTADLGLPLLDGLSALWFGFSQVAFRRGYSPEEWARREAVLAAVSAQREARTEAVEAGHADEASEAQALRREFAVRDNAEREKLKHELGVQWHRGLMQSLVAVVGEGVQ